MGTWHLLHLLVRILEALVGTFCVATAILLYPSEDGKIQSVLEDFWARVDDYKRLALSRSTAFMTGIAQLETRFLNRVFGNKLISAQVIGISFCCSLGAVAMLLARFRYRDAALGRELPVPSYAFAFGLLAVSMIVSGAFIFIRKRKIVRRGLVLAALIFLVGLIYQTDFLIAAVALLMLPALVPIGLACDFVFIFLTRRLLKWAEQMDSTMKVAYLMAVNITISLILIGPWIKSLISKSNFDSYWVLIGMTNIVDAVLAMLFVLFAALLLIQRVLWPLFTRTVFRIQEVGTKGRRAILTTVGVALLSTAVFGEKFAGLLKEVVKSLGGRP